MQYLIATKNAWTTHMKATETDNTKTEQVNACSILYIMLYPLNDADAARLW